MLNIAAEKVFRLHFQEEPRPSSFLSVFHDSMAFAKSARMS
jgi:hypothetical protein